MNTREQLDISVVMLSFNSAQYLDTSIKSVIDSLTENGYSFDIYIVDNGSRDGSVEKLQEMRNRYPGIIKLKLYNQNTGTTLSRNYALKRINSRYILVLDSDAYVNPQAVSHLVAVLEQNSDIGMAVPKILYPSGSFQKSTDVFPTLLNKFIRYCFLRKIEKGYGNGDCCAPVDVDYAISAFWLIRGSIVKEVGLLDENIFYSPEDVDYCIRVRKKGYRIVYDQSVHIVHDAQEISRRRLNKYFFSHLKGLFYLFRKHRYGFFKRTPI